MTGNSLVLDTSVAIAVLNDDPTVLTWLAPFAELLVPAVALGELQYGMRNSNRAAANVARLDRLVARCRVLPVGSETARHYAEVRLGLKRAGRPIPENDMWIAAAAIETGRPLAGRDAHFGFISGLQLLSPP